MARQPFIAADVAVRSAIRFVLFVDIVGSTALAGGCRADGIDVVGLGAPALAPG